MKKSSYLKLQGLVDSDQVCSNYVLGAKNGPAPGSHRLNIKSTFSEHGQFAYQIKGNEPYNNILANNLVLHLPFTPP